MANADRYSVLLLAAVMVIVSAAQRKWIPSASQLGTPRAIGATVFYNESFLIAGGCEDPSCSNLTRALTTFQAEDMVLQELPPLPTFVQFGRYREFVGVAGFYSTVTVGTYLLPENEVSTRVWVVGACSLHFLPEMSVTDALKYRTFWGLSADLNRVDRLFQTDSSVVPLRVNASCATFGSNIYVVGGVLWHSRELTNSVDVFNVALNVYQTNVFQHAVPVMNAAVAVDSNMLYVAGGQTTNGSQLATSPVVMGYRWPPLFLLNQSLPLLPVQLPNNTHIRQREREGKTLARIFAFAGFLVMVDRTDAYSYFSVVDQQGSLADGAWAVESSDSVHIELSSIIGFSQLDSFEGTRLTFYSFGGFAQEAGSIVASSAIFFRLTSISIPGPPPGGAIVIPTHTALSFQLEPPSAFSWIGRLSPGMLCFLNANLTNDEPVVNSSVTFVPLLTSPRARLCLGRRASAIEVANVSFFAVCDPYARITVLSPIPSPPPSSASPTEADDDEPTFSLARQNHNALGQGITVLD